MPELQIENLVMRYGSKVALNGVNLHVGEGNVLALIGPSGAGKSTLIRCVNRLVEPSGGRIHLGSSEITVLGSTKLRHARRHIGMIFQEFALVDRLTCLL